ncbi:ATP-binding cassette domain-containing protein, partial [Gammaproteobacteria bacterium]|nr:ATP-binding cassette domain-containing protein [Gammaproteobacteria bacterium]
ALQRMTQILPAHIDSPFSFSLLPPKKSPATLMQLSDCAVGYDGSVVLSGVKLRLTPGDRIGLLGANGAGKSTLVKLLAGELECGNGGRETARDLRIGYFAQRQLEQLHPSHTPVEHLIQIGDGAREQVLRNYLGGFGFSKDQALSPIGSFSGGEKSRLVLALIVYQRPNLLLLDEPTNHLDIEMRQALANALQEYPGAMVLVSHDRHLLRVTCDELLLIDQGRVRQYDQSLDDYARWLTQRRRVSKTSTPEIQLEAKPEAKPISPDRKDRRREKAEARKKLQPLNRSIKNAEVEMDRLLSERRVIEDELSDQALYEDSQKAKLKKLLLRKAGVDRSLGEVEVEWMRVCEELEVARKGI